MLLRTAIVLFLLAEHSPPTISISTHAPFPLHRLGTVFAIRTILFRPTTTVAGPASGWPDLWKNHTTSRCYLFLVDVRGVIIEPHAEAGMVP